MTADESHDYFLRVTTRERPWWLLWLVVRVQEHELHPPRGMSAKEVFAMADRFREAGAEVEVEQT